MFEKELKKSNQDSAWKEILDVYFREFMEFFYPEIAKKIDWAHGYSALDKELQSIATDSMEGRKFVDKLFRVKSISGADQVVLTHIEIQGQKEDEFPLRLFQYYYRLFDLRKKPIVTLAVLTDENKSWHPTNYQAEVWDISVLNFNFQTCKLIDYIDKKRELDESNNPFAVVVLAHLAFIETKKDPETRFQIKFRLTRKLYERGYNKDYVLNLFKVIDWVLVIPKEFTLKFKAKIHRLEEERKVSYITSIEQLGKEQGLQQGLQQGRREEDLVIAKRMLVRGTDREFIKDVTGLSDQDLINLEN